jgi:hypothetical protein
VFYSSGSLMALLVFMDVQRSGEAPPDNQAAPPDNHAVVPPGDKSILVCFEHLCMEFRN